MIRATVIAAALLGCGGTVAPEPGDASPTDDAFDAPADVCAIPLETKCDPQTWKPTCCKPLGDYEDEGEMHICSTGYTFVQRVPNSCIFGQ